MDPGSWGTDASGAAFQAHTFFLQCRRVRRLRALFVDVNVGYLSCIFEWFWAPLGAVFGPEMDRQIVFVHVVFRIHAKFDFEHPLQGFEGFTSSWQC